MSRHPTGPSPSHFEACLILEVKIHTIIDRRMVVSTLSSPKVRNVLAQLREDASSDAEEWEKYQNQVATNRTTADLNALVRLGNLYLAVSEEEGELLYFLARLVGAKRLVEFGASFGVSTLYLAAAAADNGGHLVTTEVHPDKCRAIRRHLKAAQLDSFVTLLEGDARKTLSNLSSPVDFLLLDGWKSMYLPVLELLQKKLSPRALICADNYRHEAAASYLKHVQQSDSGMITHFFEDMAVSCYDLR